MPISSHPVLPIWRFPDVFFRDKALAACQGNKPWQTDKSLATTCFSAKKTSPESFHQFLNENSYYPKNPDPSKIAILRTRTQTLPLEGPRILRVPVILTWFEFQVSTPYSNKKTPHPNLNPSLLSSPSLCSLSPPPAPPMLDPSLCLSKVAAPLRTKA